MNGALIGWGTPRVFGHLERWRLVLSSVEGIRTFRAFEQTIRSLFASLIFTDLLLSFDTFPMTCLQSGSDAASLKSNSSGAIQTEKRRTLGYIYQRLTASRSSWTFPVMFLVGVSALTRMLIHGVRLYVLPNT
ncbi:hypothetical protein JTE90_019511 [Oedothorax gibbosus]|uniref:Uncharacterized protein n=1 Tax=Oedothorax gibbosus TaxID=931172 RepID=A0AAV6VFP4_9ARAC|nr:hypothetical protein JTE90_019511 [Oedothorax gibbosus]